MMAAAAFLVRNDVYTAVAGAAAGSAMESVVGLVAETGVLVLVATAGLLAAWTWTRERHLFLILASAGVGVVGTYATSEVVKLVVAAQRPCQALGIETVLTCPAVGDWSWPSNHASIAGALATACILAAPRTAWLVIPVAALIAASRVAAGVQYAHDVLSGLALGVLGVTTAVIVLRQLTARLAQAPVFRRP
jgi:undecaprenyl-diphosphatase